MRPAIKPLCFVVGSADGIGGSGSVFTAEWCATLFKSPDY